MKKYFKYGFITSAFLAVFILSASHASAAAIPVAGADVLAKSIMTRQVLVGTTDQDGNFNIGVPDANGQYDIFIGDESITPVRVSAQNTVLKGRILILTDGTETKEPTPTPVKKTTPIKKLPVKPKKK